MVAAILCIAAERPVLAGSYTFTTIDAPAAIGTFLNGINDSGQIVGTAETYSFLLSGGTYNIINPPYSEGATATGINDSGQVVGNFGDTASGVGEVNEGFLLSEGYYAGIFIPGS